MAGISKKNAPLSQNHNQIASPPNLLRPSTSTSELYPKVTSTSVCNPPAQTPFQREVGAEKVQALSRMSAH